MKKTLLVLVFSILSLVSMFAENVELKIHLLNGTVNTFIVDSSIDEIFGFKMHLSFNKNGKELYRYEHKSPIIKIENLSMLSNIEKVELSMELHNFVDISGLESVKIKELIITYGLNQKSLGSIIKMPNLKVLYLNSMEIFEINSLDLSKTKLEYIEISSSKVQKVYKLIFPDTLKYLNLVGNNIEEIDDETINQINSKNITVFTDKYIPGIKKQINGTNIYKRFPQEYKRFLL